MLQLKTPRKTLLLLLLCLLAPSIWMIATIPPLWRDADAYVQITQDPRVSKFWGHAPLYCYVVKVPLFLGEQWERLRGLPAVPRTIASQPAVTDSGIGLLIVAQHLGMSLAVLLFICAVTQIFWARLLLVLIWASNALFYTFAHCVGSETLGIILVLWLCARAVRLVRTREPLWWDWYFVAALLLFCMLTRDLNIGLVALLPLTFLFASILEGRALSRSFRLSGTTQRSSLQKFVIAVALGIACIAIAPSVPESLARKTKLHPHSRFGYIFLWRLHSLSALPPDSRTTLMQKVSERAPTEEVRRLVRLYEQMMSEHADAIDPTGFINQAVGIFGGPPHWEEVDAGLRQMAFAFLWPPTRELWDVAKRDFVTVMKSPETVISDYLFYTTAYYFEHKEEMTACANLSTFRGDATAEKIQALPLQYRYFHLWEPLTYRSFVAIWFIALVVFIVAARRQRQEGSATAGVVIALVVVGLFQFAVTCVIHDYEPRFSVSMWQLLLLSFFLLIGNTADLLRIASSLPRRQSPPGS
jgi:hypothetical protein